MKAITQTHHFGNKSTLNLKVLENPLIKGPKDILILIFASDISSGDQNYNLVIPFSKLFKHFLSKKPLIRGICGSGQIIEIGKEVTAYFVGQRVNFVNSVHAGSMAEYIVLQEDSMLAPIGDDISYEQSVPIGFSAMKALHFINDKTIIKGSTVLIYGANSAVGTYAVQLAYLFGANITSVATKYHQKKLSDLKTEAWVDYQTSPINELDKKYDFIFDASGKFPVEFKKSLLQPHGRFLSISTKSKESLDNLKYLNTLHAHKSLTTIIDKVYDMEDFKDAHRHVFGGRKTGNVVLKINKD
jgi:NADPH:quinone reductase-like Zn-dependent oxidoreductase